MTPEVIPEEVEIMSAICSTQPIIALPS